MTLSAHAPRTLALPALLACLAILGACGGKQEPAATDPAAPSTALGSIVKKATDGARAKLANENIALSPDLQNLPKAEITPQGDLLIDGKAITLDATQRQLLREHRTRLIAIAEAGIAVGVQGADLGMKAASMALKSVISGNTEELERQVEAEAAKIEIEALKICELLPPLLTSQQALAAVLPQFAPYASMTQGKVDDCRSDAASADNSVEV